MPSIKRHSMSVQERMKALEQETMEATQNLKGPSCVERDHDTVLDRLSRIESQIEAMQNMLSDLASTFNNRITALEGEVGL